MPDSWTIPELLSDSRDYQHVRFNARGSQVFEQVPQPRQRSGCPMTHACHPLCYRRRITRVARVQTVTRHGVRGRCSAMTPSLSLLRIVESSEAALRLEAARLARAHARTARAS